MTKWLEKEYHQVISQICNPSRKTSNQTNTRSTIFKVTNTTARLMQVGYCHCHCVFSNWLDSLVKGLVKIAPFYNSFTKKPVGGTKGSKISNVSIELVEFVHSWGFYVDFWGVALDFSCRRPHRWETGRLFHQSRLYTSNIKQLWKCTLKIIMSSKIKGVLCWCIIYSMMATLFKRDVFLCTKARPTCSYVPTGTRTNTSTGNWY